MTTFSAQVSNGNDDAHEIADGTSFNVTAVTMRCEASLSINSRWNCAFRIANVPIPPGSTITNAFASVVFPVVQRDSPDLDLYLNKVIDAPNFVTEADVTSRPVTDAVVPWNGTDLGHSVFVNSPDLSSLVSEVVGLGGWAEGNAIAVIAKGQNVSFQENGCRFTPYNNSSVDACKLTIEFETEPLGEIKDPILWHAFYLPQLEDVELDPPVNLTLSESTICLCLSALIAAENRNYWRKNFRELNEAQWSKAEEFIKLAIEELSG